MRVLVTRARGDAGPLETALREAGHQPVGAPLTERQWIDAALPEVAPDTWVLWTSGAAVTGWRRLAPLPVARHAAVGRATAAALEHAGALVERVGQGTGADLVALLGLTEGAPVVYPCAEEAAPATALALEQAGARLRRVVLYRTVVPAGAAEALAQPAEVVVLLSPSAARAYAALALAPLPAVVIGPTTAEAAREAGLVVRAVASPPGVEGLVAALM